MSEASAVKGVLESFVQNEKYRTSGESQRSPFKREISTPAMKAVGVLYAKVDKGTVCFELFYESHIDQAMKDEIAARFGIGAHEWRSKMSAFFSKYKGYLLHTAAIAVVFLTPSVQAAIAANPKWAALGGAGWGYLLHWANGK